MKHLLSKLVCWVIGHSSKVYQHTIYFNHGERVSEQYKYFCSRCGKELK